MKSLKKGSLLIASLAILFIMVGCGNQEATKDSTKLQIVTSFYPMYDFTQNVAGDNAEVSVLMKAGTEPHDYEPSAKDIAKIADSDVFVYNSKEMETWVSSVLTNIDTKKTVVVDASQGIDLLEGNHSDDETEAEHEGHSHAHDPHIWLDPVLAQKQVDTIKEGIIKADTKNKETYEKNALAYKEKLAALNEKFEMGLKNAENRTFVTQHAAFAYLANRYDLEQVAIAGLSPDQEPSPAKLAELNDFIKENNIKIIYFAETASPKIAKTVANETGAKLEVLSPIEGITQEEQEKGVDYIKVMEKNLEALEKAIK
ncbi:MAG: metal ABC transporter substrate-binding protein [Carnobacterium sp.]|jgi:zinc transport system substrate-binding protein|uniref:Zinc transport system zinc-binding lipoprotein AdcA n=2 Tax=Carnobacterium maltaromaticum TaxID=2751 RepID=K8EN37_CARML|nr:MULTISPECIES: metal ABC transporter substrate-binding protein [Carnobacterium]AOA03801.1 zinc ABC transporter substrate-binding protein [Carnobacterium maltaromaticum]KRN63484.1 zinc-binding lipoprotein AdcA [Carnobacterium maltaromaticum DSM 20342]KRN72621.1 zinc-binding lipoprotein AdcA [Carnobacterium maltaromaticum]KRN84834.1 zinc-binding lipoprotein AdcA [Carnobacterium maltaromaticum]MBC9787635.1 zinc ABC transporter substrate-binding protein [Carnobacterium maltaromaticum]